MRLAPVTPRTEPGLLMRKRSRIQPPQARATSSPTAWFDSSGTINIARQAASMTGYEWTGARVVSLRGANRITRGLPTLEGSARLGRISHGASALEWCLVHASGSWVRRSRWEDAERLMRNAAVVVSMAKMRASVACKVALSSSNPPWLVLRDASLLPTGS